MSPDGQISGHDYRKSYDRCKYIVDNNNKSNCERHCSQLTKTGQESNNELFEPFCPLSLVVSSSQILVVVNVCTICDPSTKLLLALLISSVVKKSSKHLKNQRWERMRMMIWIQPCYSNVLNETERNTSLRILISFAFSSLGFSLAGPALSNNCRTHSPLNWLSGSLTQEAVAGDLNWCKYVSTLSPDFKCCMKELPPQFDLFLLGSCCRI